MFDNFNIDNIGIVIFAGPGNAKNWILKKFQ